MGNTKAVGRWRKEIGKVLVDYDKRYTVASLTILLDKIEAILAHHTATIIERLEGLKIKDAFRFSPEDTHNAAIDLAIKEIKYDFR